MHIFNRLLYYNYLIFYQVPIMTKLTADKTMATCTLFLCFIFMNNFAFMKTIPIDIKINELYTNKFYKLKALINDSILKCLAID